LEETLFRADRHFYGGQEKFETWLKMAGPAPDLFKDHSSGVWLLSEVYPFN
jgi:hypothetical protein